jgi:GNAT superfamily N-acetyltransferase
MNLRTMTKQDIPAGLRLKDLAGWNQTAADWNRFLEASPSGCFVAEVDEHVCGTVTTISFEERFAWVGMVLVDREYRNRGIGTQLLERAIAYLDQQGIPTIKLDATPQGKPLYEKLRFVTEYQIQRWILKRTLGKDVGTFGSTPASLSAAQLESIFRMDQKVFGADRISLLRSLQEEIPHFALGVWNDDRVRGYLLGRRGSFADHLGPWMASDEDSARLLLDKFLARSERETIVVDCLPANRAIIDLLRGCGFSYSRTLTRMHRGPNTHPGDCNNLCAIMGPEFG